MKPFGLESGSGLALALVAGVLAGCATQVQPLPVAESIDLQRYAGKWYEIASIPHFFQRGCAATTATYTVREDGRVGVLNECRIGGPSGRLKRAEGVATVVDATTNARLEVSFAGPFKGDYWILDVGPSYEYAVIGHPSRNYLWVLARQPEMSSETLMSVLRNAARHGYDLARVEFTEHNLTADGRDLLKLTRN